MYKMNYFYGFVYLVGILILSLLSLFIFDRPEPTIVKTYIDIKDENISKDISNFQDNVLIKNIEINEVDAINKADFIIMDHNENNKIDGYKKVSRGMYSPLVLLFGEKYYDDEMTTMFDPSSNQLTTPIYTNLKTLLEGIEKNKKMSDIYDIKENIFEDNTSEASIFLPATNYGYDEDILDLFILNLNEGEELKHDTAQYQELEKRASNILKKCKRVDNYEDFVIKKENNNSYDYIMLIPEAAWADFSSSLYNNYSYLVYPKYNKIKYFDIYYKESNPKIVNFYKDIKNSNSFSDETGLRIKDSDFSYNDLSSFLLEIIKTK